MSSGLVTITGTSGQSTTLTISRPGGHSITDAITVSAAVTTPGAPTASTSTAQTSGSLTFPVTLNAAGDLPTVLAWRYSTDNATWTNGSDLTLSSPTLGQTVNETVSVPSASTLYYVQFAEKNTAGTSAYCTSVTGTTSAAATGGTSVTALYTSGYLPYGQPAASQSTTLPLTTHAGTGSWRLATVGTRTDQSSNTYVQTTGGGATQSAYWGGFVSEPLAAQTLPTGTYTFSGNLYAESGSPYKFAPIVYVYRPSTTSVVGYLRDSATGIGSVCTASSATSGRVVTFTGTGFAVQNGDRLVVEVYAVGTGSDFIHFLTGNAGTITEGGGLGQVNLAFPSAIQLQQYGTVRVGPTGVTSSVGALAPITVASDADFRTKLLPPLSTGGYWDTSATATNGSANPLTQSTLNQPSIMAPDLVAVDTTVTFTDRDAVVRNTFHITIKPAGGAPLSSANDSLSASSAAPQADFYFPSGRGMRQWMVRRLFKFKPGFRLDCPNNTTSNTSGFNAGQSGAYKCGPHPENDGTRADLEITGGQNYGNEYLTGNFGVSGTTPYVGTTDGNNYNVGTMSTIMPSWNTNGAVWEMIRVMKVNGDGTGTQAVYIGKVTDATLVKVHSATSTLASGSYPFMTAVNVLGKNFNRQLASTDTFPELWVSDTEITDLTDPTFSWPSQIAVADRI